MLQEKEAKMSSLQAEIQRLREELQKEQNTRRKTQKLLDSLWTSGNATLLAPTLGQSTGWDRQEEFNIWVIQDKENGQYINLLEIFIVFCIELQNDLKYFM
jgi:hypothetical protein